MVKKIGDIFYGWWIVAAGIVLCIFGYAGWFYGYGTLFTPISTEFGWSRATTSIAFSFSRLEGGIEGPIVGPLVDKFGPRFMIRIAWTVSALGFLLMSQIHSFWMFILSYSLLLSLGMNAGLYMPLQTAVARWFDKKRGMALGSLTTGAAFGGSLVPVVAWLVTTQGWRNAVIILGIAAMVIGWVMSFIVKPHGPEHYGLRMDGEKAEVAADEDKAEVPVAGLSLKEAMKTQAFWLMVIAYTFAHTAKMAIAVHQIPLVEDMGISSILAATALGAMTLMSAPGRFVGGILSDRWKVDLKYQYALAGVGMASGLFILSRATSMSWVWAFAAVFGLSDGFRVVLEVTIRANYFGRKAFGSILGYMNLFAVMGSFGGPYLAGWVYDATESYAVALLILAGMMIASVIVMLLTKLPMANEPKQSST